MPDLIDRQTAIDAVGSMLRRKFGIGGDLAEITLAGLPSAQEERTEERTETHACDCIDQIDRESTIEPRCETCEAFNKTRLLIPQPQRKKGKWIYGESEAGNDGYYCSKCGNFVPWKYDEYDIDFIKEFLFCNKCGAEMREPEDIPMEYFESGGR